jgi:hypothetical protein
MDTPITDHAGGSFPFRTGISAVRIAIAYIIKKTKKESASFSFSSSKKRTSNRHQ